MVKFLLVVNIINTDISTMGVKTTSIVFVINKYGVFRRDYGYYLSLWLPTYKVKKLPPPLAPRPGGNGGDKISTITAVITAVYSKIKSTRSITDYDATPITVYLRITYLLNSDCCVFPRYFPCFLDKRLSFYGSRYLTTNSRYLYPPAMPPY
jgi:hypothetical protein